MGQVWVLLWDLHLLLLSGLLTLTHWRRSPSLFWVFLAFASEFRKEQMTVVFRGFSFLECLLCA